MLLLQLQLLVQFHRQLRLLGLRTSRRSTSRTSNQKHPQAPFAPHQCSLQHVDGSRLLLQFQLDFHFGVVEFGRGGSGGESRGRGRSRSKSRRCRCWSRKRSGDSSLLGTKQLLLGQHSLVSEKRQLFIQASTFPSPRVVVTGPLTSRWDPEFTELGLSCSDLFISSRKLMMVCSLASLSRAPPSGRAGWLLSWLCRSRLSVVKQLASLSCSDGHEMKQTCLLFKVT